MPMCARTNLYMRLYICVCAVYEPSPSRIKVYLYMWEKKNLNITLQRPAPLYVKSYEMKSKFVNFEMEKNVFQKHCTTIFLFNDFSAFDYHFHLYEGMKYKFSYVVSILLEVQYCQKFSFFHE